MEKSSLLLDVERPQNGRSRPKTSFVSRLVTLCFILATGFYILREPIATLKDTVRQIQHDRQHISSKSHCRQVAPLHPPKDDALDHVFEHINTGTFRNASIARHSGAVQIPTESFDDMGPIGEDVRWEIMYSFENYLVETFPKFHATLRKENVNTHGLLYTWQGSDDSLKPLILMAHQDVVPVPAATVDAWTHPPYSGFYDGKYIWGRGSSDCKNQLIAIMEVVELYIGSGWKPRRTIIVSLGFDEEVSGPQGAGHLAPFLLDRYGKDSIAAIVDEGNGYGQAYGGVFAAPGVGEKGYIDVHITVRMPGGHSSIPSTHTSIGVLSEIITQVEAEQYPTYLSDNNPYLGSLQCAAAHAPNFPKKLRKLLSHRTTHSPHCQASNKHHDALALEASKLGGPGIQYLMQTSQAVDIISGGIKSNALPERASAVINHRINIGDTQSTVRKHLTALVAKTAKKHNLTLNAFSSKPESPLSITLSSPRDGLEPAPVTPTRESNTIPYAILAGTTRALHGENMTVTPGIMTGNTDTRYYWGLSKHIFRWAPGYDPDGDAGLGKIHTVDERVTVENHLSAVRWFAMFLRNMDAGKLEGED